MMGLVSMCRDLNLSKMFDFLEATPVKYSVSDAKDAFMYHGVDIDSQGFPHLNEPESVPTADSHIVHFEGLHSKTSSDGKVFLKGTYVYQGRCSFRGAVGGILEPGREERIEFECLSRYSLTR